MASPKAATSVAIAAADVAFLDALGAISHRGGGEFSRSVVLGRVLKQYRDILSVYDPSKSGVLPAAVYQLVLHALPEPWTLKQFEIEHLEAYLASHVPGFAAAARGAGLEPAEVTAAIAKLNFAEKMVLVVDATRSQAPAASQAALEVARKGGTAKPGEGRELAAGGQAKRAKGAAQKGAANRRMAKG